MRKLSPKEGIVLGLVIGIAVAVPAAFLTAQAFQPLPACRDPARQHTLDDVQPHLPSSPRIENVATHAEIKDTVYVPFSPAAPGYVDVAAEITGNLGSRDLLAAITVWCSNGLTYAHAIHLNETGFVSFPVLPAEAAHVAIQNSLNGNGTASVAVTYRF